MKSKKDQERQKKIRKALEPLSKGLKSDGTPIEFPVTGKINCPTGCPRFDKSIGKKNKSDKTRY